MIGYFFLGLNAYFALSIGYLLDNAINSKKKLKRLEDDTDRRLNKLLEVLENLENAEMAHEEFTIKNCGGDWQHEIEEKVNRLTIAVNELENGDDDPGFELVKEGRMKEYRGLLYGIRPTEPNGWEIVILYPMKSHISNERIKMMIDAIREEF